MENRKGINFFFAIIAIIVGSALYKQFDFEKMRFEKPALAVIYMVVFIASIFFIIKDYRKRP
jgi:hypothetical protein